MESISIEWVVMGVLGSAWTIMIGRYFMFVDNQTRELKKEIESIQSDITEIKVLLARITTKIDL
jgi:hypothetical protein